MNHQFNQCWHKVKNNSLLVCFNFSYQWNIIAVYQFPPALLLCLLNECCINHIIMIFTGEKNMCCKKKPKYHLWSTFLIRIWSPPNYCDYRIIFCPLEMDIFGLKWVAIFKDVDAKNNVILKAFNKVDLPDQWSSSTFLLDFQLSQPIGTNYTHQA